MTNMPDRYTISKKPKVLLMKKKNPKDGVGDIDVCVSYEIYLDQKNEIEKLKRKLAKMGDVARSLHADQKKEVEELKRKNAISQQNCHKLLERLIMIRAEMNNPHGYATSCWICCKSNPNVPSEEEIEKRIWVCDDEVCQKVKILKEEGKIE